MTSIFVSPGRSKLLGAVGTIIQKKDVLVAILSLDFQVSSLRQFRGLGWFLKRDKGKSLGSLKDDMPLAPS